MPWKTAISHCPRALHVSPSTSPLSEQDSGFEARPQNMVSNPNGKGGGGRACVCSISTRAWSCPDVGVHMGRIHVQLHPGQLKRIRTESPPASCKLHRSESRTQCCKTYTTYLCAIKIAAGNWKKGQQRLVAAKLQKHHRAGPWQAKTDSGLGS